MSTEDGLSGEELDLIDDRARQATPGPWVAQLETRYGLGGGSFIDLSPGADTDDELYLTYSPVNRVSPNAALDADLEFIAHARSDIPRLVAEIRRLRR